MFPFLLLAFTPQGIDYDAAAAMARKSGEAPRTKMASLVDADISNEEARLKETEAELAKWPAPGKEAAKLKSDRRDLLDRLTSNRRYLEKLKWVKSRLQSGELIPITEIHPVDFSGETIGTVFHNRLRITQVAGEDSAIVALWGSRAGDDKWIEGVSTKGWVDGMAVVFDDEIGPGRSGAILLLEGSKTYTTVLGASRTIQRAYLVDIDKLNKSLSPKFAGAFDLTRTTSGLQVADWVERCQRREFIKFEKETEDIYKSYRDEAQKDLDAIDAEFRKWESADGKFSTVGRLMFASANVVTMERKDPEGERLRVERVKLSKADNEFIDQFIAAEKERKKAK